MPFSATCTDFRSARILLAVFCGIICTAAVSAPILAAHTYTTAAGFIYFLFSPICHQLPARSFIFAGHPMAVCHRCTGIYTGLFLISFTHPNNFSPLGSHISHRMFVLCGSAPILLDAILPYAGIWTNTPLSRAATGFIFGAMVSALLVPGISEFLHEAPWRRFLVASHIKGDFS